MYLTCTLHHARALLAESDSPIRWTEMIVYLYTHMYMYSYIVHTVYIYIVQVHTSLSTWCLDYQSSLTSVVLLCVHALCSTWCLALRTPARPSVRPCARAPARSKTRPSTRQESGLTKGYLTSSSPSPSAFNLSSPAAASAAGDNRA